MAIKAVGIILIVLGAGLLTFGAMESDGIGAQFQEFFTGAPPDRVIWMLLAGGISLAVGLFMAFYPVKSKE